MMIMLDDRILLLDDMILALGAMILVLGDRIPVLGDISVRLQPSSNLPTSQAKQNSNPT